MPRGPQKLNDRQLALLGVVRSRRIERDNAREQWEIQVARMKEEFFADHDEALRSAVWACADAKIPDARIKQAANVSDHRTYKSRFFANYVPPVVDGWDIELVGDHVVLSRFLDLKTNLVYGLQDAQVVVEPKSFAELDERELAEQLSAGQHAEQWRSALIEIEGLLKGAENG